MNPVRLANPSAFWRIYVPLTVRRAVYDKPGVVRCILWRLHNNPPPSNEPASMNNEGWQPDPQGDVVGIFVDLLRKTYGFLLSRAPKHGE